MADSHVEIVGLDKAARDMERWAEALAPAVDKAAAALASRAAGSVRARVPSRSGRLAGSVAPVVDDEGVGVGFGAGVPYAGWIEFGGTRGRPYVEGGRYLWPTVESYGDEYQTVAEDTVTRTVERFSWS